jgi:hypothetical protein
MNTGSPIKPARVDAPEVTRSQFLRLYTAVLLPHTDIRELMHAAQTQVSDEVLRAFRVEFIALAVISGLTALNAMRVPKIKL